MGRIQKYWDMFLDESNMDKNEKYYDCFCFGRCEQTANELLILSLNKKKKATCSSLYYYDIQHERLPKVGALSIVTDWDGKPYCVIETTGVTLLPFNKMTYEMCKREGEDESLESWIKKHKAYFREEGSKLGYKFEESMLIVFEDFEIIHE